MTHRLWTTQDWKEATTEEVITALFNAPQHILPEDMWAISNYHPEAKAKYLNLFYGGTIPKSIKKINNI